MVVDETSLSPATERADVDDVSSVLSSLPSSTIDFDLDLVDDDNNEHSISASASPSAWPLEVTLSSDSFDVEFVSFDKDSSDEEQFVDSSLLLKLVDIAESDLLLSNWQLLVLVILRCFKIWVTSR